MLERDRLRAQMIENAAEINRLHKRIHETYVTRAQADALRTNWSEACEEFHARYGQLCLPGGWDESFKERLRSGESRAVEAALCFLEVRPYFFRSGYMWKDLLRKCKRVPMSNEQAERLSTLLNKYDSWKSNRKEGSARGAKVREDLSDLFRQFDRQFPVFFQDTDLDGIETIGKLYQLICHKLKIEPSTSPEKSHGKARKPFSPGRKLRLQRLVLVTSETHKRDTWNGPDVWATLVACVQAAYVLNDTVPVSSKTTFHELSRK